MSNQDNKKKGSSEPQGNESRGFIKEEYAPPKKFAKGRKRVHNVGIVLFLAIMFGVIARASYFVSDSVLTDLAERNNRDVVDIRPSTDGNGIGDHGDSGQATIDKDLLANYDNMLQGIREAGEALSGGICTISACQKIKDDVFESESELSSTYAGVIVADNSLEYVIVTTYSRLVSTNPKYYKITFHNGITMDADLLDYDEELDLALLTVSHDKLDAETKKAISIIALGDSDKLSVGSLVIAIGAPNGITGSVDFGMVTSLGETHYIVDSSVTLIRTNMMGFADAEGILVNSEGKLVGFLTHAFDNTTQIQVAIAAADVQSRLNAMINRNKQIRFGVYLEDLSNVTLSGLQLENGILITDVVENSVAYENEFRKGDIILSVGDRQIYYASQFGMLVQSLEQGQQVEIAFYRNGKKMTKTITAKEG